ncbi:hypothetical protein O181_027229 [Austropuccinia psidii MF-1]|uniref:Uncharacterized protein n=1 Tax=Austropuccinia psidii MF-1 TaxID=1389203 RepID=A0A9Q3CLJ7_9BASI|nr:hypothetical protein [Austropuccinia psidii MF-1]
MTQERITAYEKIRKALIEEPLLLIPGWNRPLTFYIYSGGDGLGEALHKFQIIDEKPTEGTVCYISPGRISRQSSAIDFTSHRSQYKILLQSRWCHFIVTGFSGSRHVSIKTTSIVTCVT